jgi:hypothetical protein
MYGMKLCTIGVSMMAPRVLWAGAGARRGAPIKKHTCLLAKCPIGGNLTGNPQE